MGDTESVICTCGAEVKKQPHVPPCSLAAPPDVATCRHCRELIRLADGSGVWGHVAGPGSILIRCDPDKSGKPYGLNAEPADV